ncbi:MAG: ABC transporter substrate-binding protein [Steroidobacteraceae bacterium]|jgi:NitT/TauT family transport system substrate-binding protein
MRRILSPWTWAGMMALAGVGVAAQAATQLSVGYTNTISFTGLFVARDQGLFARHGLDVKLVLIALNSTIPSALVGGSIQIGGTTPPVFLQASGGGLDVVVIAGGAVNNVHTRDGGGVVARTGVTIGTPKDFEGKRVGVPGIGAFMQVLFRRWLTEHGVDYKKVNFVEVPLAQSSDILKSGNVDAVLVVEPFFDRILKAGTGHLVSPFVTEMPDGLFAIYYSATRSWARSNAATIKAFREALADAAVYLEKNPESARQILAKATRLPPDVIASVTLPTLRLQVPLNDVKYWSDTLLAQGMIKVPADPANLVIN